MTLIVNVIIPTYNDASSLAECLEALSVQSLSRSLFDVSVVDNGSQYPPSIPANTNIRLLTEPRAGSYAARNLGITATQAPLIAFTDADCIPDEHWLVNAVDFFRDHPVADVIGGAIHIFPANPDHRTAAEILQCATAFPQESYIVNQRFAATANVVARRSVFDDLGLFSDALKSGGDVEWGNRIVEAGYTLVFAPDVAVRHPARRSISELLSKQRRTMAGTRDLEMMRGQMPTPPLKGMARPLVPPIASMLRALRNAEVGRLADRAKLAGITFVSHYATVYLRLRLRLGAPSPR